MNILNFSTEAVLDSELKPVTGYQNGSDGRGFVFQWYQSPEIVPRVSAKARELMTKNFLGKFTSLKTYEVGSGWYCTEVSAVSGKPSGVLFYMDLSANSVSAVEGYVRNLRNSSPLSVLTSFAFNVTPRVSVVPGINGTTKVYSVLPSDRGISLDVTYPATPDGIVVDWKNGTYSVAEGEDPAKTVIGRAALTLASFREE